MEKIAGYVVIEVRIPISHQDLAEYDGSNDDAAAGVVGRVFKSFMNGIPYAVGTASWDKKSAPLKVTATWES